MCLVGLSCLSLQCQQCATLTIISLEISANQAMTVFHLHIALSEGVVGGLAQDPLQY